MDAPHVYVRAWALGCFHNLSGGADRVGGQLRGNKSGRVWRKVPESDARSVAELSTGGGLVADISGGGVANW